MTWLYEPHLDLYFPTVLIKLVCEYTVTSLRDNKIFGTPDLIKRPNETVKNLEVYFQFGYQELMIESWYWETLKTHTNVSYLYFKFVEYDKVVRYVIAQNATPSISMEKRETQVQSILSQKWRVLNPTLQSNKTIQRICLQCPDIWIYHDINYTGHGLCVPHWARLCEFRPDLVCPKCFGPNLSWMERQTRSVDEGLSLFEHCLDCHFKKEVRP